MSIRGTKLGVGGQLRINLTLKRPRLSPQLINYCCHTSTFFLSFFLLYMLVLFVVTVVDFVDGGREGVGREGDGVMCCWGAANQSWTQQATWTSPHSSHLPLPPLLTATPLYHPLL